MHSDRLTENVNKFADWSKTKFPLVIADSSNQFHTAAKSIQKNSHEFQIKLTPFLITLDYKNTNFSLQKYNNNKFFCT